MILGHFILISGQHLIGDSNEHKAADEQEEGEVEHPDNAAVGDQEDHEPVEYEEPAAQQEVRSWILWAVRDRAYNDWNTQNNNSS